MSDTALDWLTVIWLTVIGAVIGSFLNVVIHRLPRGESLSYPPSHCPKCGHPIRWYDNVPIVSWLLLRGRCRDCDAPISPRYPMVEAICMMSFLVLGVLECALDGVNLPDRPIVLSDAITLIGSSGRMHYEVFLYHQLLLCSLLAAGLIQWDGQRVPRRLFYGALGLGALMPIVSPSLHPVAATPITMGPLAGLIDSAAGLLAGGLIGWLVARLEYGNRREGTLLATAAVGVILGWQAVVAIGLLLGLWIAARRAAELRRPSLRRLGGTMMLAVLALLWIILWRPMAQLPLIGGW